MAELTDYENTAEHLRTTTDAFCKAFIAGASPTETLDKFFTSNARITEHGPAWATERLPFLGITFGGRRPKGKSYEPSSRTCDDYYDLLTSTLSFHPSDNTVPSKEQFMIDPEKRTVTIKLHATFASIKTGKSWEEDFIYVLSEFDDEYKIGCQELWADPLSAWAAVGD